MRIIKKFTPNEVNATYKPTDRIELTFPNQVLDLHTFVLYYDFFADFYKKFDNSVMTYLNAPKLSQSIIQKIIVKVDGVVVQEIEEYGFLFNIIQNFKKEDNDFDGDDSSMIHRTENATGYITNTSYETSGTENPIVYSKFIDKWLGFFEGDRYFDARKQTLSLEIILYPSSILYTSSYYQAAATTTNTNPISYDISNVFGTITVVDNFSSDLNNTFTFKDYQHKQGIKGQYTKSSQTMIKTKKPLLWMLGTFSHKDREVVQNLQLQHYNSDTNNFGAKFLTTTSKVSYITDKNFSHKQALDSKKPNVLNNSIFFKRDGRGVKTCQFRVNGSDVTPPMTVAECYNETKRIMNNDLKIIKSLQSFQFDFFTNMIDYEENEEGMKQIDWFVNSDNSNFGGTPHLFICFKNQI